MSISKKLLGAFFSLTLITLSLGVYAAWSISYMAGIAYDIYDRSLMSVSHARAGAIELNRTRMLLMQFGLAREELKLELAGLETPSFPSGRIVTGSIPADGADTPEAGESMSERQRLLSAARLEFGEPASRAEEPRELSERGRLIALARAQTGDPIAELLETSEASERQRLIAIARSQDEGALAVRDEAGELSERERLIAQARAAAVEVATADLPDVEADVAPQAKTQEAAEQPQAPDMSAEDLAKDQFADVDGDTLAEALTDQLETVIEEFEVVRERAASEGAVQLASKLITDINAWMELNENLLSGNIAAGIVSPAALVQMIVSADELVEQVAADGFETTVAC